MNIVYLLRGMALGFPIAAPVGPIGVLCIRRTLAFGRVTGLVTGLGAATADGFYGAVAAFGLTVISSLLTEQRMWIHLVGAAFLAYLGVRTLLARPAEAPAVTKTTGLAGAYASTVALTLANPATIISFAAIFAGAGVVGAHASPLTAGLTVAGVVCGSALWWLVLSTGVSILRRRFSLAAMRWVNALSGCVLLGFAVYAVVSARA